MAAPGELSLSRLLSTLVPVLHPSTFVFATFPPSTQIPTSLISSAQMVFRESEGTTLIITQESAEAAKASSSSFEYAFPCRMVTLDVHSSLEAVGFIAFVANKLKDLGMGVNPVSGFYHDHCFVPVGREQEAMGCLRGIVEEAKEGEGKV